MDWASLAAFVAVAEHGGFSAAAGQLHLTQPAVSKRIAALEQSLQARLFDRLGRQVVLTEAGRALLPRARQMLAEAEAARRALQDLGQDIGGRLSLATSHHVGLHRLPALLRHFTALHPRAALDIRFMDSEQAYAQVLQGQVDLAVTTLGPSEPPLRATPVWNDPLLFAVAPDHPLARLARPTLADIAAHPAVLPVAGVQLSRQLGYVVHGGRTLSRAAQAFIGLLDAQARPVDPAGDNRSEPCSSCWAFWSAWTRCMRPSPARSSPSPAPGAGP